MPGTDPRPARDRTDPCASYGQHRRKKWWSEANVEVGILGATSSCAAPAGWRAHAAGLLPALAADRGEMLAMFGLPSDEAGVASRWLARVIADHVAPAMSCDEVDRPR